MSGEASLLMELAHQARATGWGKNTTSRAGRGFAVGLSVGGTGVDAGFVAKMLPQFGHQRPVLSVLFRRQQTRARGTGKAASAASVVGVPVHDVLAWHIDERGRIPGLGGHPVAPVVGAFGVLSHAATRVLRHPSRSPRPSPPPAPPRIYPAVSASRTALDHGPRDLGFPVQGVRSNPLRSR
jgi:hypothetical protein